MTLTQYLNLSDEEQIFLYWEYCANNDNEISFSEFDEMMKTSLTE